jgi:hypothetical protein
VQKASGNRPPGLSAHTSPQHLLALQRQAGNQAVAELVASHETTRGVTCPPTAVQRAGGDPIVVQLTLADTVKQVAAAIGVAATVGAIAAYFFIPAALAYAVLAAAGGLGTAVVVDRLQARSGHAPGTGTTPTSPSGPPTSGKGKKGKKGKKGEGEAGGEAGGGDATKK